MSLRRTALAATTVATLVLAGVADRVWRPGSDRAAPASASVSTSASTTARAGDTTRAGSIAATAMRQSPLRLVGTVGGDLGQPLVADGMVYLPVGRTLSVWDYRQPRSPQRVGLAPPAPGVIQALARHGSYLYASWREGSCRRGGVTVYSIANPRLPRAVGEIAQYAGDVERTCAAGLAVAQGRLYLFDTENDLYVGDLGDPRRPRLQASGVGPGVATQVAADGNLLWAAGRSFLGGTNLRSIDISVPDLPRAAAFYSSPGTDIVNVTFQAPHAYGFGHSMSVLDLRDPAQISLVGRAEMPYGAFTGLRLGNHVYSGGFHGLDVWSLADATQPAFVANHDLRTFAARNAVQVGPTTGLMLGTDDRLLAIDASEPERPRLASERIQPGGVNAMDVGYVDGYPVVLQYDYGITVVDPRTFVPLARLEPPRPDDPETRGYTAMAIDGHTAYLAVWGYGLIVVDLSTPLKPREIARLEYPFASSVEVAGDRLYLGKNTNGPTLGVVDIGDPSQPALLSNWSVPDAPWAMASAGNVLFSAEAGTYELAGGVRILDMSDPANVVQLARWDGDCESATDIRVDASRNRLYVACRTGLRILDVADPASPRLIGGSEGDETPSTFVSVAIAGDRAWYASGSGIAEFDVSVPARPRLLRRTALAGYETVQLRNTPTRGLIATTWSAGLHRFEGKSEGK